MADEAAVIDIGVDVGAPDVGGDADNGDAGVSDEPEVVVGDTDAGDAGGDGTDGDAADSDPNASKQPLTFDQLVKKVDALKATDPQLAKELRKALYSGNRLSKHFETPEAAAESKQLIERLSLNGEAPAERLQALETAAEDFELVQQALDAGDSKFIDSYFQQNPEGAAKMVAPALSNLYKSNVGEYQRIMSPMLYNSYTAEGGPVPAMTRAYQQLKSGNVDGAIAELDKFGATFKNLEDSVRNAQNDPLKGEREKLATREKEVATKAEQNFNKLIDSQVKPLRDNILKEALKPYMNGLPQDRQDYIFKNVLRELGPLWDADAPMQKQYATLLKTGDANRIVKFVESKLKVHGPTAVGTVTKALGLAVNRKATAGGNGAAKPGARTTVKANGTGTNTNQNPPGTKTNPFKFEPKMETIDMKRTSTSMRLNGEAYDKQGRYYRWN